MVDHRLRLAHLDDGLLHTVLVSPRTLLDWGRDMTAMNAAIFIQPKASGALIENNRMQGPGFGSWVDGAADVSLMESEDAYYYDERVAKLQVLLEEVTRAKPGSPVSAKPKAYRPLS